MPRDRYDSCAMRAGSCSWSAARSASSPAGGMAKTSGATTTSRAPPMAHAGGCSARAHRGAGSCMDASPEADAGEPAARHGQYGEHGEYAELHCLSNFSFLRGASHPAELISRAQALGYRALALTDECSMAGVVRAHVRAKEAGLQLIIGAEFTFTCGLKLVALAATRLGYGRICQLITRGRRAASKGSYRLAREDLLDCIPPGDDCLLLWHPGEEAEEQGRWLAARYAGTLWLAVSLLRSGQDAVLLRAALDLAARLSLNCMACGDV